MNSKVKLWLLFLIGFFLYLPSFGNQFVWDDEQFIYRNAYVREFNLEKIFSENTIAGAGENSNYYRPLTTLSFAIDHAVWGLRPFGFHLTNTLLHSLNGVLLYLLLTSLGLFTLTKTPKHLLATVVSDFPFLISLLFLIHPLQTEAVTYINSRGDSLYVFFTLLGLIAFQKILVSPSNNRNSKMVVGGIEIDLPAWLTYFPPLAFFSLSLLSKEIALATLALYFLIFGLHQIKKGFSFSLPQALTLAGLFSVATGYLFLRATVWNFQNSFNFYNGTNVYTDSLLVRLITFSHILWEYFRLLIVPYPLHMERDPAIYTELVSLATISTAVLIIFLLGLSYWEWKRYRTLGVLFGSGWFFAMLAPVSGIVPINGLMYEHWLYLPMVGFWIVMLQIYSLTLNKVNTFFVTVMLLLCSSFAVLTLRQNYLWRHPIPFYEYTLKYTNSARLHNNLAMAYSDAQRQQDAIREYQAAIEQGDFYPQVHYNLANTYLELNDLENAEKELLRAIELSPQFYLAHQTLLKLYLHQERWPEAERLTDELLIIEPTNRQLLQLKNELKQK